MSARKRLERRARVEEIRQEAEQVAAAEVVAAPFMQGEETRPVKKMLVEFHPDAQGDVGELVAWVAQDLRAQHWVRNLKLASKK